MFSWKPLYAEIAARLPAFADDNAALVALLREWHRQGLKTSSVSDRGADGVAIPLEEVDPFTFLANFNRAVTDDNRRAILAAIKSEWGLESELPADFEGLPVMNPQSSWFMPYKQRRDPDHVGKLWRFYLHCLEIESAQQLDTEQFDACCALRKVAPASLTMGMFWSRPDIWIAVDKKSLAYAASLGVTQPVKTGADYLDWLSQVLDQTDESPCDFSLEAHRRSQTGATESESTAAPNPVPAGERNYWLIAPGKGAVLWDAWYAKGVGAIGWNAMGNLADYGSKEAMAEHVSKVYEDSGPVHVAHMLWEFAREMQPGDVVFAKRGLYKVCGWGLVAGDYRYDENEDPYHSLREIDWQEAAEITMPTGVQLPIKTITRITGKTTFLAQMAEQYDGIPGLEGLEPGPEPVDPPAPSQPSYGKQDALADLFMPEEQVDTCIDLLRRKKNLVLQGAPGTGKTFVAKRLAYLLMEQKDDSRVQMVQFHQSLAYEDFVQGFKPNGDGGFRLESGAFHSFVEAALAKPSQPFVFIIDEINRGNMSKVFGELMMLIEPDKRSSEFAVPLSYSPDPEATFYVPPNVHLIGTMNTADRSLSMVDYALRRRFAFVELDPGFESPVFAELLKRAGASDELVADVRRRMQGLNAMIASDASNLGRGYRIGHSFFCPTDERPADGEWLRQVIRFEIAPLLEEYYCDDLGQLTAALELVSDQDA